MRKKIAILSTAVGLLAGCGTTEKIDENEKGAKDNERMGCERRDEVVGLRL